MGTHHIALDGDNLTAKKLWAAAQTATDCHASLNITLTDKAKQAVDQGADYLHRLASSGKTVYGINTGFGYFAKTKISPDDIETLQENIIVSHACGVGEPLPRDLVMGMWLIMLNSLARGHRGLKREKLEQIIQSLEKGMLATVPSRGSVGASGDLAPMAHGVLALIGQGECSIPHSDGFKTLPAQDALDALGLHKLVLGAKEGLCLINGTQLTTAMAVKVWHEGSQLLRLANLAAAMNIEALRCSHGFLDPILMQEQHHPGAFHCAQEIEDWLQSPTEIQQSHSDCDRVQDPYSIRCVPQVHGVVWEELRECERTLDLELNATTDNPILFPEQDKVIHGGNFHAIYSARCLDRMASALTTLANISERRINMAMKQGKSGLPNFLIQDGGLNSGFMMAQTTAAALASECKSLSFPASVDTIPTNNDQEDHVSMGPIAGLKALQIIKNLRAILAIELLAAAQGLDLLAPLKSSHRLEVVKNHIRERIPMLREDRFLGKDIEQMQQFMLELLQ